MNIFKKKNNEEYCEDDKKMLKFKSIIIAMTSYIYEINISFKSIFNKNKSF